MLCREVIVVYWVKQKEHTNTGCEKNPMFNCETGDVCFKGLIISSK